MLAAGLHTELEIAHGRHSIVDVQWWKREEVSRLLKKRERREGSCIIHKIISQQSWYDAKSVINSKIGTVEAELNLLHLQHLLT